MRDKLYRCVQAGVTACVLLVATGAKPPPPVSADPTSDVPRGKPPPLRPGERGAGTQTPASTGTSFIAATGRLLTNNHVVEGCGRMVARNAAGQEQVARVLATDRHRDLALLEVPAAFGPALTFRSAPEVKRGEPVITFGFPLFGLLSSGPTLTTGDVSALSGLRDNQTDYQISAPVQPGNSGGPLLDAQGNVIGVVVAKLNAARIAEMTDGDIPQNVNFAVKGGPAVDFLREQGVIPRTAVSEGPAKGAATVGDIANPSTMFLQCFH
jgi:S1-C subfamily serine protease